MAGKHDHVIKGVACRHVLKGVHPVLQVIHHWDDIWEFSCAADEHPDQEDFEGLCLDCTMKHMKEYQLLKNLEVGQWASRTPENELSWEFHLLPPHEEM